MGFLTRGKMATTINKNSACKAQEITNCHFLPFSIDYDGDSNASSFFSVEQNPDHNDLKASFRGRPLDGCKVDLPAGYTGFVISERRQRSTEEEERNLEIKQKFSHMNLWNLDKKPTLDDSTQKAFQWIDVSNAIHEPIPEADECRQHSKENEKGN